jgi:hypothetical protein
LDPWTFFYLSRLMRYVTPIHSSSDTYIALRKSIIVGYILKVWTAITGNNAALIPFVNEETVTTLQSRAPAISQLDANFVRSAFKRKQLFPGIRDAATRQALEKNVLGIELLIPTLLTLFKCLRSLEPATKAIKVLLPRSEETLRQRLRFCFSKLPNGPLDVQDGEGSFTRVKGSFDQLFDLAIRQFFLSSMRWYFTHPSNISSKKNMNPILQTANPSKRLLGFRLLELSRRWGFLVNEPAGESKDAIGRLFIDMLGSLPKDHFRIRTTPDSLVGQFKVYSSECAIIDSDPRFHSSPPLALGSLSSKMWPILS